jgi:hypothetical protein
LSVEVHEGPRGLARESDPVDSGEGEGVENPRDHREEKDGEYRAYELTTH